MMAGLVQNTGLNSSSSCCTSVTWKMTSNGEMGKMGANWAGNRRKVEV
jgi:hypothetical protein